MTVEHYEQVQTCPLKCALRKISLISLFKVCTLPSSVSRKPGLLKGRQKTKSDFSHDLPVASFVVLMNPLAIKIAKFHNTKLRTVPHGTVREVRLVRILITRSNVPYPYLSNNYVPYKRTVLFAKKWSVPYRTCVPYRTVLPSLSSSSNS